MAGEFDVVIVGGGPAGLFAAYEIAAHAGGKVRVALVERGLRAAQRRCPMFDFKKKLRIRECVACTPCHVMQGIGGAGALSSGTINLRPDVGGDLDRLLDSWDEAQRLIDYVDSVFAAFGAPDAVYRISDEESSELERLAARAGAKFIPTPQRHMGTENTVKVIENITRFIEERGVKVYTLTQAHDVEPGESWIRVKTSRGEFKARYVILAPGRSGADWFAQLARRRGIETEPGPLDVGVRVEVPAYITEPITRIVRDPKIIMYTRVYDDKVRTFCVNPNGFVVEERYPDGTVGVNGESYMAVKSKNTNFALLVTLRLTDPMEDTIEYGKSIARLATKLGGGKPIIQRFGDLEAGRRSTWSRVERSAIEPTLKSVTPGDIGMAYPYRVVANIIEGLERLDKIMPGVASPQTLLYAPEIKFYSVRAVVSRELETSQPNIFAAGDGAGLSRGINVAAATGVIAARSVLRRLGVDVDEDRGVEAR
ncbi:NAD(P)/FAD-dependent oxidoreductase [Stetteria hydrogenophila]